MKRGIHFAWRWSWIVTVPVTVVFIYWCLHTIHKYSIFGVRYQVGVSWYPATVSLRETGTREFMHLRRHVKLAVLDVFKDNRSSPQELRRINLFISQPNLALLDANLPHSGFDFVEGGIIQDGKLQKVKVRYRGDHIYHWGYFKKSWRVKTKKSTHFEGMRKFNLISPRCEQLNNYLGYRLAALMGLITPRVEMVQLNINGKNQGLYAMVEQLEELTLRYHNRMPGDLYAGDSVGYDKYHPFKFNFIFNFPMTWKKMAVNNHYPLDSLRPLEHLLFLGRTADTEMKQQALTDLLDLEAWGRFAAMHILMQTEHFDNFHNWRLYYDPIRSKFEPVVWDTLGWYELTTFDMGRGARMDIIYSILWETLYKNGDFLRALQDAMESFFTSGTDQTFLREADLIIAGVDKVLATDPNLRLPVSIMKKQLKDLKTRIENVFHAVRRGYLEDNGEVAYQALEGGRIIPLQVSGRLPLKSLTLHYLQPIREAVSARIRYQQNGRTVEKDIAGAVRVAGTGVEVQTPLIARFIQADKERDRPARAVVKPAYYELLLNGVGDSNRLLEVVVKRGEKKEQAVPAEQIKKIPFEDMYCVVSARPVSKPELWSGIIKVDRVLRMDEDLMIEPGTVVRLGPGASLVLKGRLIANGTEQRPIQFLPAEVSGEPWGTLTLLGPGADGSQLSHCIFSGGSGLKGDLYEYSAMFSAYDVSNVAIRFCAFYDSNIVDDMLRGVYADIRFSDCVFDRAYLDAVDLDISNAVIKRCRFLNAGNDGLDLMVTRAVVMDSEFRNNGDKGISVGEDSGLLAINNRIVGNRIGLQPKDRSVAVLYNVDFEGNAHAVDAYRKNWRYEGGGKAFLYKARIFDNEKTITACKESDIWIYDSYIDRDIAMKKKRIRVDRTVDSQNRDNARQRMLWRYPEEITYTKDLEDFFETYWASVKPDRRGVWDIGDD